MADHTLYQFTAVGSVHRSHTWVDGYTDGLRTTLTGWRFEKGVGFVSRLHVCRNGRSETRRLRLSKSMAHRATPTILRMMFDSAFIDATTALGVKWSKIGG